MLLPSELFRNIYNIVSNEECFMVKIYYIFQILKPADKKKFPYSSVGASRPVTPPRSGAPAAAPKKGGKK